MSDILEYEKRVWKLLTLVFLASLFYQLCRLCVWVIEKFLDSCSWWGDPIFLQSSNLSKKEQWSVDWSTQCKYLWMRKNRVTGKGRQLNLKRAPVSFHQETLKRQHMFELLLLKLQNRSQVTDRGTVWFMSTCLKVCRKHLSMVQNTWFANSKSQSCRLCPNLPLAISSLDTVSPVRFS